MIHILYKTTCVITKKYYIGIHSTKKLNDGYLGSGKIIRASINKHGKENHVREILEFLDTRNVLMKRESDIVNKELLNDPLCMNLVFGGNAPGILCGARHHMFGKKHSEQTKKMISENRKGIKHSEEAKLKISVASKGKTVSDVTKQKISIANKAKMTAERRANISVVHSGKIIEDWHKQKIGDAKRGKPNPRRRPVMVDGIEYECLKIASEVLDIPKSTLQNRLNSENFKEVYFKYEHKQ